MLILSIVLVFVATFSIAGTFAIFGSLAMAQQKAHREHDSSLSESVLLRDDSVSTISPWAHLLEHFDFIAILGVQLEQAGLAWSPGRFTSLMLLSGSVGFALSLHFRLPLWLCCGAGLLFLGLPYFFIRFKRSRRFHKFEQHFPDALDSLARALRAGHPFSAGMEIIAAESVAPVSTELRRTALEGNLGMPWEQALSNLARRIPLLEVNLFVAAVQLQTRTGGKLSELLDKLSESMRETTALQGEIRAAAAHGKLTGIILSALPVFIALGMYWVNPAYIQVLLDHPYGYTLIGIAAGCLIAAQLVIRRIVDIRV